MKGDHLELIITFFVAAGFGCPLGCLASIFIMKIDYNKFQHLKLSIENLLVNYGYCTTYSRPWGKFYNQYHFTESICKLGISQACRQCIDNTCSSYIAHNISTYTQQGIAICGYYDTLNILLLTWMEVKWFWRERLKHIKSTIGIFLRSSFALDKFVWNENITYLH